MKQRAPSKDSHKKVAAPAFVVEEGKRQTDVHTISLMYGCANTHALVRQVKQLILAHGVINYREASSTREASTTWNMEEVAAQVLDQCDEQRIRALAIERIKQVTIDEIVTKPGCGQEMFRQVEQLRKQHNSVDKVLAEMGG